MWGLAASVFLVASPPGATPAPSLAVCDARVSESPGQAGSYLCYWMAVQGGAPWEQAAGRIERRLEVDPSNPGANLYLAIIRAGAGRGRSDERLRTAIAGFVARHDLAGEVRARVMRARWLDGPQQEPEAAAEIAAAERAAAEDGDPELDVTVLHAKGLVAVRHADYGEAWVHFKKADALLAPAMPLLLHAQVANGLGRVAFSTGRAAEAFREFGREAERYRRAGNISGEAAARYNLVLAAGRLQSSGEMSLDTVRGMAHEALDLAMAAGNRQIETLLHTLLSQDPGLPVPTKLAHAKFALDSARASHDRMQECVALRRVAGVMADAKQPEWEGARRLVEEAIGIARELGSREQVALGRILGAGIRFSSGPREAILSDGFAALDAIERIRDVQRDDTVKARVFGEYAFFYYKFAGRLLRGFGGEPGPDDLEKAFRVAERLRARTLLDYLDTVGAARGPALRPAPQGSREAVLEALAKEQKELAKPGLAPGARDAVLRAIDRLEVAEQEARLRIARADPRFALVRDPTIPSLADVRSKLAPEEALLAFQLSTRRLDARHWYDNGGSWVFVVTRGGVRVVALPDADLIERDVRIFDGLFGRRDGSEAAASARLHEELLSDVLHDLPPEVSRLVVVPDLALHRLPFDALRDGRDGARVAERFSLSIVPSATLWWHWRTARSATLEPGAIVVADPAGAQGRLPWSRDEADRVVAAFGERTTSLIGTRATEGALREALPTGGVLVHLATHATVDEERPDRSAILLAPAGADDGLLQAREIAALDLRDRVVVLSSCDSASGALLRGEGVMSLARAFFQAGARAVVAGLWPLRDDEQAGLMTALYLHLARGESLGQAMANARRDRILARAPAAAWSGVVVLGDASVVPLPRNDRVARVGK